MAATLNISIEEKQKNWLNTRRERGGFSSFSDVVRSLIREAQDKEHTALLAEFQRLDQTDGAAGPEPVERINDIVKIVKAKRRASRS